MGVDRLLYRQLLRQGRRHDRTPALKALLANARTRVYHRNDNRWLELEPSSELVAEQLQHHATRLFGSGSNCAGVWYAPQRSLAQLVRDGFRHDEFAGRADGGDDASDEERVLERRDVAFCALRQLQSNLQFGRRVLSHYTGSVPPAGRGRTEDEDEEADAGVAAVPAVGAGDGELLELTESPLHCAGLLIAHPLQCSGAFWRTMLLVCKHNKLEGAMALVLNRSTGKRLGDVVTAQHLASSRLLQMLADHPLYYGGPVAPNALFYLHTNDHVGGDEIGGGSESGGRLYMRPAMHDAAIENAIDNGEARPEDFRLFCGYTGWGPDQLEGELDQNAWFTARCGGKQSLSSSLMTLADGPSWPKLDKFREGKAGGFGLSEESLRTVDPLAPVDPLEHSMQRWCSALTLLGGEHENFGAHFQRMPHDLDEQDVLEIHKRAVG